ncbi:hypothetical protein Hanom_Chr17g01591871 [Helianthus anomalus]
MKHHLKGEVCSCLLDFRVIVLLTSHVMHSDVHPPTKASILRNKHNKQKNSRLIKIDFGF